MGSNSIASPNFPSDYPSNSNYFWSVSVRSPGTALIFETFVTEQNRDYVTVIHCGQPAMDQPNYNCYRKVWKGWTTSGPILMNQRNGSWDRFEIYTMQTNSLLI